MKNEESCHACNVYEKEDKKKELVKIRNAADTLVFTTEKAMKDADEKLTEEKK